MSIRTHLAKRKLHMKYATSATLKLLVYYPDQGRFITVGYGNQRQIKTLAALYTSERVKVERA